MSHSVRETAVPTEESSGTAKAARDNTRLQRPCGACSTWLSHWHAAAWSPDPLSQECVLCPRSSQSHVLRTPSPTPVSLIPTHTCSHSRHPVKNEGRISVSWLRLHSKPAKTCEKVVLFLTLEPRQVAASSMSGTEVLLVSSPCDIPSALNSLLSKATASYRRCLFYPRR